MEKLLELVAGLKVGKEKRESGNKKKKNDPYLKETWRNGVVTPFRLTRISIWQSTTFDYVATVINVNKVFHHSRSPRASFLIDCET